MANLLYLLLLLNPSLGYSFNLKSKHSRAARRCLATVVAIAALSVEEQDADVPTMLLSTATFNRS
jgi:hypothetical protein